MQVRRSPYLVNDTLLQIQNASANNTLKRPLKVQFIGEQGVDEGGVQKVCTSVCMLIPKQALSKFSLLGLCC